MPKNKIPEPTEAIDYVKRKLPVATGKWNQLKLGEHVHAFTVAHSTSAAVVNDIFEIMAKSIKDGTGMGEFKKNMRSFMARKGWYGRPGKTAKDKKYINWRLRTIYQTNVLTAYSAGETREMLAPNFIRYEALRKIKVKGKSVLSQIMTNYREEMSGYQLTQAEWNIYVGNLPDEALPDKHLYADALMMFSTLRQDAAEAIGEDVKLMVKDRSIIHGARKRSSAASDINFSQKELRLLPQEVADPEAIYKDSATGAWIFRYALDSDHDAKVVFHPAYNLTSMVLQTFFKVSRGSIDKDGRFTKSYERK